MMRGMRLLHLVEQKCARLRPVVGRAQKALFTRPAIQQQAQRFPAFENSDMSLTDELFQTEQVPVNTCVSSVLPTPVGPRNKKLPRGRPVLLKPSSPRCNTDHHARDDMTLPADFRLQCVGETAQALRFFRVNLRSFMPPACRKPFFNLV